MVVGHAEAGHLGGHVIHLGQGTDLRPPELEVVVVALDREAGVAQDHLDLRMGRRDIAAVQDLARRGVQLVREVPGRKGRVAVLEGGRIGIVRMGPDADAADAIRCRQMLVQLGLRTVRLDVAEDDEGIRKAMLLADLLQPDGLLQRVRARVGGLDMDALDDVRSIEFLEEARRRSDRRADHLVVAEQGVVARPARIREPVVMESLEFPQMMVGLDQRDAAIHFGHDVLLTMSG